MHQALAVDVEAGVAPMKAIQRPRSMSPRLSGKTGTYGSVEPEGRRPVHRRGDPLQEIRWTQNVKMVVMDGAAIYCRISQIQESDSVILFLRSLPLDLEISPLFLIECVTALRKERAGRNVAVPQGH